MPLTAGSRLGPYQITAAIGAGGMGEVYRALDSNLGRQVAVKILAATFAHDPERLARFEREAKTLATLNHPNIAQLYGFEKTGGTPALVMELVEGPTLADRIAHGPIQLDEALPIAKQIAEALQAAHEQGIIHRDLKPANVKVRSDGTVKVLDFGLAKILEPTAATAGALTNSPTLTSPVGMTGVGVLLGTAAYMSPEQARGRPVDARSDSWAFGCVLFEMLSGRAAFANDTIADTLSAIVTRDPDWTLLPPDTPGAIHRLMRRCLAKDPHERLHAIADARLELADARLPATALPSTKRSRLPWAIAAASLVAALAMGALTVQSLRAPRAVTPVAPELRLEVTTPPTTDPLSIALSPDGRRLTFVASSDGIPRLWLRPLAAETAQPLPGTDFASYPFWSPDSQSIAFFAGGKLKRLVIGGGQPQILADAAGSRGGTWSRDGVIVFSSMGPGALRRVSADSPGEPSQVTQLTPWQPNHRFPQFLPDGRHFLYLAQDQGLDERSGVYLGTLDSHETKHLTSADTAATYLPPNHLLYVRQGMLVARRLNLGTGALDTAVTVADRVGFDGALGIGAFSASDTGMVAYRLTGPGRRQLTWFDRSSRPTGTVGDADGDSPQYPQLSRDGQRVLIDRTVQSNRDIYLFDLVRSAPKRLTFDSNIDITAVWSPDASRILFRSRRKGLYGLYVKPSTPEGAERVLVESENSLIPNDWSPDGKSVVYVKIDPETRNDLYVLSMDTGSAGNPAPTPFLVTQFDESQATFSPNGKWIAYQSNDGGPMEIYLRPFPPPPDANGQQQISTAGGASPRWRRDGSELYYLSPDMKLMAVPIRWTGSTPEAGTPVPLFPTKLGGGAFSGVAGNLLPQYDVSSDGRFLMNIILEERASPITIVVNWKPD